MYLGAIYTGLRRAELESLEWGDVHMETETTFLAVRASTTKNGKNAIIPLHPELLDALARTQPANAKPNTPVFAVPTIEEYRADLKRAGIPYEDARGGRADFHALRVTFGTLMMLSGVNPRTAQELMRHIDIKLTTQIYTDSNMLPTAAAIHSLPSVLFAPHTAPQNTAQGGQTSPVVSQAAVGSDLRNLQGMNGLGTLSPAMSQGENGARGGIDAPFSSSFRKLKAHFAGLVSNRGLLRLCLALRGRHFVPASLRISSRSRPN